MKKLFLNGRIYVSFKPKRLAEALVVSGGRVIYSGSEDEALKICKGDDVDVIDLNGKVVLPGFIDSHLHLDELGIFLNSIDLRGVRSIEDIKEKIREFSKKRSFDWILGYGWDHEMLREKRFPTRWDLDEVVEDVPVLLLRSCLHAGVLNTKAMKISGLLNSRSNYVMRDERGEPTGVVLEKALKAATKKFKEGMGIIDYERAIKRAIDFVLSNGITAVGFVGCKIKPLKALMRIRDSGELSIRIRVYSDDLKVCETGYVGDDCLKIIGIKVIADGSLGVRTAWLSEPYSDAKTCGTPNVEREELRTIAKIAKEKNLQLAVHGIGDRTVDMILDVYESVGVENRRYRIEHASVLRDDQIRRMSELKVVASVQPRFVLSDVWIVRRLGTERARLVYRFRSMIKGGIVLGFGTDSPVEPINPWETVYASVTRGKYENPEFYELTKHEILTLEEALHCYTYGSAYIMFEEKDLGTLEKGKFADFIVVDRDPFDVDENELKNVEIMETYVGGERVFLKNSQL